MEKAKQVDSSAYIFWLDSDDTYHEKDAIDIIVRQMEDKKADISVFNFEVAYEDSSQKANAAQLEEDRKKHQEILESIQSRGGAVSPLDIEVMSLTSLCWTKCYGPSINLPMPKYYPFEDFVFMAALLKAKTITAINPKKLIIKYLRRSTSICGKRIPENFTIHIPEQLNQFFDVVCDITQKDENRFVKLKKAETCVVNKLEQYEKTLSSIVQTNTHPDLNEAVLSNYKDIAKKIKEKVDDQIAFDETWRAQSAKLRSLR